MNYTKAIGYGLLIWVVMFAVVSAFLPYYNQAWMKVVLVVVVALISYACATRLRLKSYAAAIDYGVVWVLVAVLLEVLVTQRFNPLIFTEWSLWVGYAATLIAPSLTVRSHR